MDPVVVVGAGIAGVACARELRAAGIEVRVVDRGRRLGGRLSGRSLDGRPVDLGASYLTVSDDDFRVVVDDWVERGVAFAWTDTFAVLDAGEEPTTKSGPVRYGAAAGLRSLVEDLAATGEVEVEQGEVGLVARVDGRLEVDGVPASAVVLAMPDTQAQRLIGDGLQGEQASLGRDSEPILAVAAWWPTRTWDDVAGTGRFDGAFVNGDPDLSWIADDGRRRDDDAPVLVAHSTPELARRHLEDPQAAGPTLVAALRRVMGIADEPTGSHVHRWSLARPTGEREAAYLLGEPGPEDVGLGVCGDGWGASPKVETAWRSGRDLGRALADRLRGGGRGNRRSQL